MNAALMARVFFNLQKQSLENFFDAWAISQGLATKAVRIWGRQMGIGETGRGYGDRWQRVILQEHDVSRKRSDDVERVKIPPKIPKATRPAAFTPPGGDTRWIPPQGAVAGCGGHAHTPEAAA